MDQIKQFLAVAKKHHFWILSGMALLMGLGGWFYATSQINADKAKEIAEIKSKEQAARSISSEQNHPNRQYVEGMDRFVSLYRSDVERAWQRKRDAQQKDLAWPGELNVSGTDFTDSIDGLLRGRPIEAVPDEELRLAVRLRERYRDYIKEELPKLAERIGAKWAPQGGGRGQSTGYGGGEGYGGYEEATPYVGGMEYDAPGGAGRGRGPLREKPPLVVWNPSNQGAIQADSFDWTSRDNNTPTTKEVLYAQENLWVLENLMDIIARTNGAITEPHQATIKRIDSIEFGREVLPINSKVARVRKRTAGTGMEGMEGMDGMDGSMDYSTEGSDPTSTEYGMEGGAVDPSLLDPAHRRYVDKDYKKLTAEELKTAMASPSADQYYLAVAKRLPVRMKLQMDQRKIDKLLVECGNANLMVEVRQVRVAGKATGRGAGGGYGGGGGYDGGGADYGGGDDYGGGGYGGGGYEDEAGAGMETYGGRGGARGKTDPDEKIFEVPVEIYGIIYIYNPVNKELLGVEEGDLSEEEGLDENLGETASLPGIRR